MAFICFTTAQTILITDKNTREPLTNAKITDTRDSSVYSNANGSAAISNLKLTDTLNISVRGYLPLKFMLEGNAAITKVQLQLKLVYLDEIIFSANKTEERKIDVPFSVSVITSKNIEFANQPTTAEVLQNTGAVFVQKSQMGGGSPILRGFEANKVLIVVDGIRMNNAIYRGGHLQDVITLDANMLERTEVIFGPSSTIYGSDALGGVMHFYTKNAQFSNDEKMLIKTNAMIRYATANNEKTGHLDFNLGWKNFASITNITYSDFGDLKSGTLKLTGSPNSWDRNFYQSTYLNSNGVQRDTMLQNADNNIQVKSAYTQIDFMQRFNIKTGKYITHNINFQYSESGNVNRYDRLTETTTNTLVINGVKTNRLRFAEWYYGPQKRLLGAYSATINKNSVVADNIKIIAAYQKIDQDRISRSWQKSARTSQREDVTVLSFNIDAFKKIYTKHELRYGAEYTNNKVTSTADTTNIFGNGEGKAKTRYADGGNKMSTTGVYVSHSWEVNEHLVISDGLRFTANTLESKFTDTTFFKFPFTIASQKNNAITGSLGFTWKEDNNYKLSLLANTGFRTPNIDDMSKVFESSGSILIVPNADIKPEYATNFELSISKIFDKNYKFDITGFYTVLENALVLADYKFNGSDSILYNGTKSKTQAMQNRNRAYVYGLTAGIQLDFNDNISFKSIINYTYGRYADVAKDTVVPLDHIPPVFGQSSILARQKSFEGEFFVRYNGKKTSADYSTSGEDNKQYSADIVNGYMPSWFTLNLRAGYNFTKNLRLNASCENITDNRYRVFASGISAPGRNFIISVRYKI
jgi:hemoglobin/transferrin/lactoferrin receptor protein